MFWCNGGKEDIWPYIAKCTTEGLSGWIAMKLLRKHYNSKYNIEHCHDTNNSCETAAILWLRRLYSTQTINQSHDTFMGVIKTTMTHWGEADIKWNCHIQKVCMSLIVSWPEVILHFAPSVSESRCVYKVLASPRLSGPASHLSESLRAFRLGEEDRG